jgi:hypothetical protein
MTTKNELLRFGKGNAKLNKLIYTFSLPAGHTCPGALACLAKADRETGKLSDGTKQAFRCFAASQEARFGSVRKSRWHNFELLKGLGRVDAFNLIDRSLANDAEIVRIHVSGDFFSAAYFLAWCDVARSRPDCVFYAYTKSISIWLANRDEVPNNLRLVASEGGKWDAVIAREGLRSAKVVLDPKEAEVLGLAIDHDDSHAYAGNESFALLIHGTQAKGTVAAKALASLRANGWKGYSAKV